MTVRDLTEMLTSGGPFSNTDYINDNIYTYIEHFLALHKWPVCLCDNMTARMSNFDRMKKKKLIRNISKEELY